MSAFRNSYIVDTISSFTPISTRIHLSEINRIFRETYLQFLSDIGVAYVYRANHGGLFVRSRVYEDEDYEYTDDIISHIQHSKVVSADSVYVIMDGLVVLRGNKLTICHNHHVISQRFFSGLMDVTKKDGVKMIESLNQLLQGVVELGYVLSFYGRSIYAISGDRAIYCLTLPNMSDIETNILVTSNHFDDMNTIEEVCVPADSMDMTDDL
jgi:hypothetical protein